LWEPRSADIYEQLVSQQHCYKRKDGVRCFLLHLSLVFSRLVCATYCSLVSLLRGLAPTFILRPSVTSRVTNWCPQSPICSVACKMSIPATLVTLYRGAGLCFTSPSLMARKTLVWRVCGGVLRNQCVGLNMPGCRLPYTTGRGNIKLRIKIERIAFPFLYFCLLHGNSYASRVLGRGRCS
jgi:hypothetical protein